MCRLAVTQGPSLERVMGAEVVAPPVFILVESAWDNANNHTGGSNNGTFALVVSKGRNPCPAARFRTIARSVVIGATWPCPGRLLAMTSSFPDVVGLAAFELVRSLDPQSALRLGLCSRRLRVALGHVGHSPEAADGVASSASAVAELSWRALCVRDFPSLVVSGPSVRGPGASWASLYARLKGLSGLAWRRDSSAGGILTSPDLRSDRSDYTTSADGTVRGAASCRYLEVLRVWGWE